MAKWILNLRMFEGDGAGAGAAPAGGGTDGGEAAVTPGTLNDGTVVDNRLAARMEEQARKRRNRGEEPVKPAAQLAAPKQPEIQAEPEAEPSLDDQWNEAKKGKFKDQYARDVQAAIKDRFKNQDDANEKLARLEPALKALTQKLGIEEGNYDELAKTILDDDSLYEEEAEELGMPVEAYKDYKRLKDEHEQAQIRQQQEQEELMLRQHFQNLAMQAEEMKKQFPDFDLRKEMENEAFRRLVAPNSGLNVHAAYYAIHHAELEPQAMAYGFQRAQNQMSQTLQANRARPVEGAMKTGQPANVAIDPKSMSREERQKLIERARRGDKIVF
jgi:hypothetical protein